MKWKKWAWYSSDSIIEREKGRGRDGAGREGAGRETEKLEARSYKRPKLVFFQDGKWMERHNSQRPKEGIRGAGGRGK